MGDHVCFEDKNKQARPTMDALFQHSKISEMEQLVLMQQHGQNPPEQTETRVGWFYEINHDGIHPNYIELNLTYNEAKDEFSGKGVHLGSGKEFVIMEGGLNKKTRYWKFIACYEGGQKKNVGRKELVQYWGWSHGRVWCGGYHKQEHEYQNKKQSPYVEQAFIYPKVDSFTL